MKQGALVNLLIGISIALLPLYNRICALDFQRTAKDNLFVVIASVLCFLMPAAKRKANWNLLACLIYGASFIAVYQWNVLSINVMFQVFYMIAGMMLFFHFHEKHDENSTDLILYGMMAGAIIQSALAIPGYFGINVYNEVVLFFINGQETRTVTGGSGNVIGSLGNRDLLASYLAITSLAFLNFKKLLPLIILPIVALGLCKSLMGAAALAAGALYLLNAKFNLVQKWQIYLFSIAGMIIYPFSGIGHDSGRLAIWRDTLNLATLKSIIIGNGAGWFPDQHVLLHGQSVVVQEHNEFISFFNVFGIVGVLLILPLFFKFIMEKDKNKIFSAILFAAFINSYGHFSLHQSTVAIIIITAAGICLAEGNRNDLLS
jgi:hypothetical protein